MGYLYLFYFTSQIGRIYLSQACARPCDDRATCCDCDCDATATQPASHRVDEPVKRKLFKNITGVRVRSCPFAVYFTLSTTTIVASVCCTTNRADGVRALSVVHNYDCDATVM